ncbi:MAG TPA: hypothetical protein VGI87_02960 [Solirubrobacteraceae bacterium]
MLLIAVALAAGCGSSGGSSSVSKADFVSKANAICTKVNKQIASLPKINTAQDLLSTGPKELTDAGQGIAKLKALQVPDSIKSQVSQWISALEQESAISNKLISAFKNKNAQELTQAEAAGKTSQAQDHSRAVALGLTACAKQVQPTR